MALTAATSLVALVALAEPAAADCWAEWDGGSLDSESRGSPGNPQVIDLDDEVTVGKDDSGPLVVVVWSGPIPVPVPVPGGEGETQIDVRRVAWAGTGLYRIDVQGPGAGDCAGTYWVHVDGGIPLANAVGVAGLALTIGGVALAVSALRRSRRGRCSAGRGVIGGLAGGAGALVVLQQFALAPTTILNAVLATAGPAVVAGVLARRACLVPPTPVTVTPLLDLPTQVVAGQPFDVRLGLSVTPFGAPVRRARDHEVTAELVVGTGSLVNGAWRQQLAVPGRPTSVTRTLSLQVRDIGSTDVSVLYSSGGQTIGLARRRLWVVEPSGGPPLPPPQAGTAAAPFRLPVATAPADLELRAVYHGPQALHVLHWTVESPHRDRLRLPDGPVTVDLGDDPDAFAAGLVRAVADGDGRPGLAELLLGAGRHLAMTLGRELVDVLDQVLALDLGRPPRVLLLTEEASVPWELVAVEPAPAGEPPFLATRAAVGRWYLLPGTSSLPPPDRLEVSDRAVLATSVLPAAQAEAARLVAELGFRSVPPTMVGAMAALEQAGIVHLACHGAWRADEGMAVLELGDGRLSSTLVAGLPIEQHPLVFLNACHVAAGNEVLAVPAGFPAMLVEAGAGACVVPLWAVRDDQARDVALAFYRAVLAGLPPAEVIRDQREQLARSGLEWATPFAYQFVGHPGVIVVAAPVPASAAA